jgi:squalene-hopene/tetraprenyl-beta-curcumene cyclase
VSPTADPSRALDRARDALLHLQDDAGWWKAELETNVTMDAEDLLLRQFLGIGTDDVTRRTAAWIRSQQRSDGTWATFYEGPPDLSTTIEAYVALRLAGDGPDAGHITKAAEFVRDAGGLERSRVFTRIWMALFGEWPWDALPAMPPEVVLLPPSSPVSIYDFASWARQTVVALTVVGAYRPVRDLGFPLDELRTGLPALPAPPLARPALPHRSRSLAGARSYRWLFEALDRGLHVYERHPLPALRRAALRAAERWIVARQESDGSWGGIQPPWVYSLMALHLRGYPLDHPVMRAGLDGLDSFSIRDADSRRLEACQSPVWDTALAVVALGDAGVEPDDPALVRAADWLLDEEVRVTGDWSVRRPKLEPGGWAFEFANVNYPDTDDTAEVVLALRRVDHPEPERVDAAIERARRWQLGMQCRDGGWAAFDVDNTRRWPTQLPFCDFGEVIDPPSADVTAHVVEMLAALGSTADREPTSRGISWLLEAQEPDGSWFGRWGVNHVYGTGAAVPALVEAGVEPGDAPIRRAVRWLERHQNADGGWGEDIRSYRDRAWIGRGASTASQTAWALLALLAAGERESASTGRGIAWLVDQQRSDGTWDEPWYTGTGFPGDFSINYHLYRLVFPVMALGRFVHGAPRAETGARAARREAPRAETGARAARREAPRAGAS